MEGRIFGVPLVLIVLVVLIAGAVVVPVYFLHNAEMVRLNQMQTTLQRVESRQVMEQAAQTKAEATPSASLTPTATPTQAVRRVLQSLTPTTVQPSK